MTQTRVDSQPEIQTEGGIVRSERRAADEAYRVLRSSVKFAAGERPVRSVLVVDVDRAQPSGVARHLAEAFAGAADRAVLIETDVRAGTASGPGFSDLLTGSFPPGAVVREGDSLVPIVGPGTAATPDFLARGQLPDAIDTLLQSFDYAILSSAPLPEHADALAIAPRVDAVILAITSGKTRRPRAIEARDALERVGARILGVVMIEGRRRFW